MYLVSEIYLKYIDNTHKINPSHNHSILSSRLLLLLLLLIITKRNIQIRRLHPNIILRNSLPNFMSRHTRIRPNLHL